MEIFIFLIVSYVILSIALFFIFPKANEEGWKGLVPVLNFLVWAKLVGRKPIAVFWLFVPIVNLFVFVGMAVDMAKSFGKMTFVHSALCLVYAPGLLLYLGLSKDEKYQGPVRELEREYQAKLAEAREKGKMSTVRKLEARNPFKKSAAREWVEAIVFAIFAAAFIRMFLIEAYTIPTSSMEGSLLVGDFLFVSKAHYGIRTPKTILMVPLLHNRIPILNRESYLAEPDLPYTRFGALEKIDRNDPVVFNYPEGDSVYVVPGRTFSVYDVRRNPDMLGLIPKQYPLTVRPLDKKDHYIKRCVAAPGDDLQIIDRQLHINGEPAKNPTHIQFTYQVINPAGTALNTSKFRDWGISEEDIKARGNGTMILVLNQEQIDKIKAMDPNIRVEPYDVTKLYPDPYKLFPYDKEHFPDWTIDNYGPVHVPEKGETIQIDASNIALYERVIRVYEDNELLINGDDIFINGEKADSYTFQMNYYWMMGDNRHGSEDSRVWGFVPENHVVGKPLFIWFSTKEGSISNGINWNRLFTTANKQ